MGRIKDDDSLKDMMPDEGMNVITDPILIVSAHGNNQRYMINVSALDPMAHEPKLFGILLSDLVDHIAASYAQTTQRHEADIRATLIKTLRDEDRFKTKDPGRARQRGYQHKPVTN